MKKNITLKTTMNESGVISNNIIFSSSSSIKQESDISNELNDLSLDNKDNLKNRENNNIVNNSFRNIESKSIDKNIDSNSICQNNINLLNTANSNNLNSINDLESLNNSFDFKYKDHYIYSNYELYNINSNNNKSLTYNTITKPSKKLKYNNYNTTNKDLKGSLLEKSKFVTTDINNNVNYINKSNNNLNSCNINLNMNLEYLINKDKVNNKQLYFNNYYRSNTNINYNNIDKSYKHTFNYNYMQYVYNNLKLHNNKIIMKENTLHVNNNNNNINNYFLNIFNNKNNINNLYSNNYDFNHNIKYNIEKKKNSKDKKHYFKQNIDNLPNNSKTKEAISINTLEDLFLSKKNIAIYINSQKGSKKMQKLLNNYKKGDSQIDELFIKIYPSLGKISNHNFGNYFCQMLIKKLNLEQRKLAWIFYTKRNLPDYALHEFGNHSIQSLVEAAEDSNEQNYIVKTIEKYYNIFAYNKQGKYIMQKIVQIYSSKESRISITNFVINNIYNLSSNLNSHILIKSYISSIELDNEVHKRLFMSMLNYQIKSMLLDNNCILILTYIIDLWNHKYNYLIFEYMIKELDIYLHNKLNCLLVKKILEKTEDYKVS